MNLRVMLLAALTLFLPALAGADGRSVGPRDGLMLGFSVGAGSTIHCEACTNATGSLYAGVMARPDLAIVTDFSVVRGEDATPGSLGVAGIALQYWPAGDRFWLKGGVGLSRTFDWQDWGHATDVSRRRLSGIAGAGVEVLQGKTFAMDVQARVAFTGQTQSVAVGLGFNWFPHR